MARGPGWQANGRGTPKRGCVRPNSATGEGVVAGTTPSVGGKAHFSAPPTPAPTPTAHEVRAGIGTVPRVCRAAWGRVAGTPTSLKEGDRPTASGEGTGGCQREGPYAFKEARFCGDLGAGTKRKRTDERDTSGSHVLGGRVCRAGYVLGHSLLAAHDDTRREPNVLADTSWRQAPARHCVSLERRMSPYPKGRARLRMEEEREGLIASKELEGGATDKTVQGQMPTWCTCQTQRQSRSLTPVA